jgi:hypothetical protein
MLNCPGALAQQSLVAPPVIMHSVEYSLTAHGLSLHCTMHRGTVMKVRGKLTSVQYLPGLTAQRCPCASHLENGMPALMLVSQVMRLTDSDTPAMRPI